MTSEKLLPFRLTWRAISCAAAFTAALWAQSPVTGPSSPEAGQIQGVVTSASASTALSTSAPTAPTGVAGVTVSAFLPGSAPAFSVSAVTGAKGSFALTGLRSGTYSVCVSDKRNGFLDQCYWPELYTTVVVGQGQLVTGLSLQSQASSPINIRVNDPGQLLVSASAAIAAPQVSAGVFDRRGIFHPAAVSQKDTTGVSFQVNVPMGTPMKVSVKSAKVALQTGQQTAIPQGGIATGILQPGTQPPTFTFSTVSGTP